MGAEDYSDRILEPLIVEWKSTHQKRLNELIDLGVYSLIMANISLTKGTPVETISISSAFRDDPAVHIRVLRSKQQEDIFYSEGISVDYDGKFLTIKGSKLTPTFDAEIPQGRKAINRQIGGALRKAFRDPKRVIDTNSNPRNLR